VHRVVPCLATLTLGVCGCSGATAPDGGRADGGPLADAVGPSDAEGVPDASPDAATFPDAGPCWDAPCLVYGGLDMPAAITSDSARVYWVETGSGPANGAVRACPLDGCPDGGPFVYAAGLAQPMQIAVDENNVYFSLAGTGAPDGGAAVEWCPKAGCNGTPGVLAQAVAPDGIAVFGGFVYWTDLGDGSVHRTQLPPGGPDEVVYDGGPPVFESTTQICAVETGVVYCIDQSAAVFRIPLDGGDATPIAPPLNGGIGQIWQIALAPDALYYAQPDGIHRAARDTTDGGPLVLPLNNGGPIRYDPSGVAYFLDLGAFGDDGTLGLLPNDGGLSTIIADNLLTAVDLTIQGSLAFWVSNGAFNPDGGALLANTGAVYRINR
jgi:hypothetical protein